MVPEYSIHGLFCLMFMCAGEWVTLGLNIPLLLYHLWRYKLSLISAQNYRKDFVLSNFLWFSLKGFFTVLQMGLRLCMILWVWWMQTFWITAKKSPGANLVSTCSPSSTICTGIAIFLFKNYFNLWETYHYCYRLYLWVWDFKHVLQTTDIKPT